MYISGVKIENFRGIGKETIFKFNPGITVLVGENDSGKSTVIDAIRYVLGTTDQNWYKVEFSDYHNENTEDEIRISICFSDLSLKEKAAFMECLTYTKTGEKLYLNWTAKYMKNVKPKVTMDSRQRGEFTFNEMKMYSFYGLEKKPVIREIFQQRFPIMFIDEAQDTKSEIWDLINRLYEKAPENVFYQAYGDSNQAIFNSYERMEEVNVFPRKACLEMLNSKRFVESVAELSNGVALDKRKMLGEAKGLSNTNPKHTIFLFKHGQEEKVLQKYAELLLQTFSDDEISKYKKYGCHVLGMVHKLDDKENEIAVRLSNYYPEYNPETKKTAPTQLIDYFYIAEEQLCKTGEFAQKVDWICKGILKLIKMSAKFGRTDRSARMS